MAKSVEIGDLSLLAEKWTVPHANEFNLEWNRSEAYFTPEVLGCDPRQDTEIWRSLLQNPTEGIFRKKSSSRGGNPTALPTLALALSFSSAEYTCPVCSWSSHCQQMDKALNKTSRNVTGCLDRRPWTNYLHCGSSVRHQLKRKLAPGRKSGRKKIMKDTPFSCRAQRREDWSPGQASWAPSEHSRK